MLNAGSSVAASPGPSKPTVLVVDDEEEVRQTLAEALHEHGYAVLTAASGADALQILHSPGDIAVMITDMAMPKMSGLDLADRAKTHRSDLKIILISGHFLPKNPDYRFLKKPFDIQDLTAALRAELA